MAGDRRRRRRWRNNPSCPETEIATPNLCGRAGLRTGLRPGFL